MAHPETRCGEIFLGNFSGESFVEIRWKSKRRGMVAYDIDGRTIDSPGFFPVFAETSELGEQITKSLMKRNKKGVNW